MPACWDACSAERLREASRADHSRRSPTFGLEALFRQYGIYSHGQLYEPVDKSSLLYYFEATNGQILEEGITEAGALSSFIAAGSAYATHALNTIPFYIFYSMFGFQRVGDLIWAASDMRARGFLLGATAGRTTLEGEGLQHQDGHSHLLASAFPTIAAYDPAFMFELAVILQDGLKRMYQDQEELSYYITLYNESYPMPAMPPNAEDGIREGLTDSKPRRRRASTARICWRAAHSSTRRSRRKICLCSATAWRPTCGAQPVTKRCGSKRSRPSGGTCGIRMSRLA